MIHTIDILQGDYPMRQIFRILEFPRSSYYTHKSLRVVAQKDPLITPLKEVALKRPEYGYRRVKHALKNKGFVVNKKRVYKIMKQEGLLCKRKRKYIVTTNSNHSRAVFPNLAPMVKISGPNQLWVGDITYCALGKRFAYFAFIMDVYSRKIVGWNLDLRIDTQLCLSALLMALEARKGADLTNLIHHSDQGVQYASADYINLLKEKGITGSMSRKGNPYDNAFAERLFWTFKYEVLYRGEQESFEELYQLIKAFVSDYNSERLHSAIGYMAPDTYEKLCLTALLLWDN